VRMGKVLWHTMLRLNGFIAGIVAAMALIVPTLVTTAITAQSAQATDIYNNQARIAVGKILGDYKGAEFSNATPGGCSGTETAGNNCYWWAAITFNALINYAEDHYCSSSCTTNDTIRSHLYNTYEYFCGGSSSNPTGVCPNTDNEAYYTGPLQVNRNGSNGFTINSNGGAWFDDIGWWTQTWINAYRWTGNNKYKWLAEGLWGYTTNYGWLTGCGGLVQYAKNVYSGSPTYGSYDAEANSLYLKDSASLYDITKWSRYINGYDFGVGLVGGAFKADAFVQKNLTMQYNGIKPGTVGSRFLILDHILNPGCATDTTNDNQAWLANQGEMVSAWSEMATADQDLCNAGPCNNQVDFYNRLAVELAHSVTSEQLDQNGHWPYKGDLDLVYAPTVDLAGVLSEPCQASPLSAWPLNCDVSDSKYQGFEIYKGLFQQGIYCLLNKATNPVTDPTLSTFVTTNAGYIANLTDLGFLWDVDGTANDGTRASVLDGLDAQIGGSSKMC
jgi:hypothetical protein